MDHQFKKPFGFNVESNDLKALQERIAKLEAQLAQEKREVSPTEKTDLAKKEISQYIREVQQIPDFAQPQSQRDDVKEIRLMPPTQQVGALVSLALGDGLAKAIAIAIGLDNPAILDEMHDTLVDSYFDQLVKLGVIKII
ncbi:MAG: hypothetical protein M1127_01770 [Patescibacteria group bacterium]|nr:hypothetical protein [Patescibacteria group bacterium]